MVKGLFCCKIIWVNFGLEKLLVPPADEPVSAPATTSTNAQTSTPAATVEAKPAPVLPATVIPGEGVIVSARQLVQVFSGLSIHEISCARIVPDQHGNPIANTGILLFTTKEGSPRAKGGAMEFEFSGGKINRIAFQLPSLQGFRAACY